MAPVGVPVRVRAPAADKDAIHGKKEKRERGVSLDLGSSERPQREDEDREGGIDKPDTPGPFGSPPARSPLPKRLKMRLERQELPAEDIAARVDARLAAAERKREEEALERTRAKARAASLRVRRAAVNRARHQSELAEAHRRKMDAASANRSSFLERRRTVARRLAAGARHRADDDDDDDDASSPRAPAPSPDAAADSIRRAWLSFRSEGGTTEAVASRYRHLGLSSATAVSSVDFDAFARRLSTPSVLRATRAMLTRAQHRLAARGRDRPSAGASTGGAAVTPGHRRFLPPRSAKENNPNGALDRRDSLDSVDEAFPTRVVLCAYMIVAHPETVLSPGSELRDDEDDENEDENENENEKEDEKRGGLRKSNRRWGGRDGTLHASAGRLVAAVDAMVDTSVNGAMSRPSVDAFVAAWDPYLTDFCAWKSADAVALERELVAAAVALETSHLRTCGSDSRSQPFHPNSDEAAVREACDVDKATLRSKVVALGGVEAAARFDDAMASALAKVEAEEDENAAEKVSDKSETSDTSSSGDAEEAARRRKERTARRMDARAAMREARTAAFRRRVAERAAGADPRAAAAAASSAGGGLANEAMMHELLIDPDWRLAGPSDATRAFKTAQDEPNRHSGREQSPESRIREQMERAFWAQAVESIAAVADVDERAERDAGPACDAGRARALAPVAELRAELESLARTREDAAAIDALRDDAVAPALGLAARDPSVAGDVLGAAMRGAVAMIRRHESLQSGFDTKRAADARADEVERSTAAETAAAVTHSKNGDYPRAARAMARAMTRSLRFCFEELRRVRREGANAALAALAPLATGAEGARWARHRFATRRRLPEPTSSFDADGREKVEVDARLASAALPVTRAWLAAAVPLAHRADASLPRMPSAEEWRLKNGSKTLKNAGQNAGQNAGHDGRHDGRPASPSIPTPALIRSGRVHAPRIPALLADGEERKVAKRLRADEALRQAWAPTNASTPEGLSRVALASLIADPNPHDPHRTLPETLEFDAERLATLQNEFQRIAVSAACVKIARDAVVRAKTLDKSDAKIRDLPDFRRRLDVLLADPTVRVPDLAAEIAARVARSAQKPPETFAAAAATSGQKYRPNSVDVAAAEAELRGLTDPSAPGGAALLDAVRAALATRLLVGPDIVSATGGRDASAAAVAAAALAQALAAQGLDGEIGVAVAGDVKALAGGAMRSIGRVNWLVHGPMYESVGAELLAEDDEL